ncbi:unnamed protein product [Somion occarium]|uniref:Uncharacterized protein n=1 Tax=Somion occarium TaxID=3059160 RepID=A0ABP1DQK9_9APHY
MRIPYAISAALCFFMMHTLAAPTAVTASVDLGQAQDIPPLPAVGDGPKTNSHSARRPRPRRMRAHP